MVEGMEESQKDAFIKVSSYCVWSNISLLWILVKINLQSCLHKAFLMWKWGERKRDVNYEVIILEEGYEEIAEVLCKSVHYLNFWGCLSSCIVLLVCLTEGRAENCMVLIYIAASDHHQKRWRKMLLL